MVNMRLGLGLPLVIGCFTDSGFCSVPGANFARILSTSVFCGCGSASFTVTFGAGSCSVGGRVVWNWSPFQTTCSFCFWAYFSRRSWLLVISFPLLMAVQQADFPGGPNAQQALAFLPPH